MQNAEQTPANGIGGWLILPAIGLVLWPFVTTFQVWTGFALLKVSNPELIGTSWFAAILGMDLAVSTFAIVVAFNFFNRLRVARVLIQILLVANVLCAIIGETLTSRTLGTALDPTDFIKGAISAAIWIPYFSLSKRVKATFVEQGRLPVPQVITCIALSAFPTGTVLAFVLPYAWRSEASARHEITPEPIGQPTAQSNITPPEADQAAPGVWTRQFLQHETRIAGKNTTWLEKGHGFSISLPQGWTFDTATDLIHGRTSDDSNREALLTVSVHQAPNFGDCDLWALDKRGLGSALHESRLYGNGFQILNHGSLTIDGKHAVWVEAAYRDFGLLRKDYCLIHGARLFCISCYTASDLDFLRQQYDVLERTANSFKILSDSSSPIPK